jgi:WD40 repeat protein
MALSPDARLLATGSDGGIELWDAQTGQPMQADWPSDETRPPQNSAAAALDQLMKAAAKEIEGVQPEKTRLISHVEMWTSPEKSDHGWTRRSRLGDGEWKYEKTHRIHQVIFSPDGTKVYSAAEGGRVNVGEIATGRELAVYRGHIGTVFAIAISPDGKTLASGGEDRTVRLWDTTAGTELARWEAHDDSVTALAFHPNGTTLVSGASDGTLKVWNLATVRTQLAEFGLDW